MTTSNDSSRQAAFVTGAGSGIGAATAVRLASLGRPVVLLGRREAALEGVVERITAQGGTARAIVGDVTDDQAVSSAIEAAETLGGLGVLVANAGIMPLAPLEESDLGDWQRTVDTNLTGMLRCVHAALPAMLKHRQGDIILVSSVAGRQTFPEASVYCATKAAMNHFADCLRVDLARRAAKGGGHLRVGVVEPGIVVTELVESIPHDETRQATRAFMEAVQEPLHPEDIAESIAWIIQSPPHVSVNDIVIRPTTMTR